MGKLSGLRAATFGLLVLPVVATPAGHAQGTLARSDFRMTLTADGAPARVLIRYVVRSAPEAPSVPLAVIPFETSITDLQSTVDGVPAALVLEAEAGGVARGAIRLPMGSADREVTIDLAYTIDGAWPAGQTRVRAPVIAVLWPPRAALPGTFRGSITLPPAHIAHDAFPATLRSDGAAQPTWVFDLQVVPSIVTFAVAAGTRPLFTLANTVEGTALALLLLFGVFGWRRFRSES